MSLAIPPRPSSSPDHDAFLAELPRIDRALRFKFRTWPADRRNEAVADGRAAAWHAWSGLLRRGCDPLEVGPAGIAANAAHYVRRGRRLGTGQGGPGAADVYTAHDRDADGSRFLGVDARSAPVCQRADLVITRLGLG